MTAVEWLVETLNNKIDYIPIKHWDSLREIIQQALEMEKQQILKAYDKGYDCYPYEPQKYYNENYKTNNP